MAEIGYVPILVKKGNPSMRTKVEAAQTLSEAGWSSTEIKQILGNALGQNSAVSNDTPWWTFVGEEWYTSGTPIAPDWEAWVAEGKP